MTSRFDTGSDLTREIRRTLRSPAGEPLEDDEHGLRTVAGERFPIVDGIVWLVAEEQREADQGDGHFYDQNPFGELEDVRPETVDRGVEEELRHLLRRYSKDATILDAGAGAGRVSHYLGQQGFHNAVSLDLSLRSLELVRKHNPHTCIWGNILCLPFESGSFDLVIATGVVHHTPDPHRAVAEAARVLTPGGRLYLRVYNRRSLYRIVHASGGALLRSFHEHRRTRWLSDRAGLSLYRWIRAGVFGRPSVQERLLRAKYGNLVLKRLVYFFDRDELDALLGKHRLVTEDALVQRGSLRMLCYVARKLD